MELMNTLFGKLTYGSITSNLALDINIKYGVSSTVHKKITAAPP